jgi:hypothetical protein
MALFLLIVSAAYADVPMALEPVTRVNLGATWVGGPSPIGVSGSFESRMTRVIAAEFGGFLTPVPMEPGLADADEDVDNFYLRHAVFGDLGFRIPHRQPQGFGWDFHFRAGGGVVWTAHVASDAPPTDTTNYDVVPAIASMGGGDLLFRFGQFGFRIGGKAWAYQVVDQQEFEIDFVVKPQISLEALIQW